MKKSNFVALILGTVGCVFFALGMCMCLIQEWGVSRQGIVCGAAGLVVLRQGRGGRGRGRSPPGSGRRGGPGHPERFRGQGGLAGAIEDSVAAGQNFIDGALAAGRNFLNSLMGL